MLDAPLVMGIINTTPDSFYPGSRAGSEYDVLKQAEKHLKAGASILDIGGYSSRPGAKDISTEEETQRLIPAIKAVVREFPGTIVSADTFRAVVASLAVAEGASVINDISAGELDPEMFNTVASLNVPYIIMHMRGNPATMKNLTEYDDVIIELIEYFQKKLTILRHLGIKDVIIDPGFGFAKTREQSFLILRQLNLLKILGCPVLAGVSRKSMIWKTTGKDPEGSLPGTIAANMAALINGANILRVHDVNEAIDTVKIYKGLYA